MNIQKTTAALLAAVLAATMVTGCTGSNGSSSETKKDTVIIGTQEMPNDEGIAKALNYFETETHMKVELKKFDSGKDANTALAAGSIDFALVGSCSAALAISQNLGVECIWIHEVLGPTESLVARGDAGVTEVKGLKGKTVATPFTTTAHFSLLHALDMAGLKDTDVKILDMQTSEIYAAWKNKQIDAAYVWEPTLSSLTGAKRLCTSADMAKAGYETSNVELVRTAYAKQHPDVVKEYIKAMEKAVELNKNDNSTAVSTIAKALKIDTAEAKKEMTGSTWLTAKEQLGKEYFGTSSAKGAFAKNLYDTASFLKNQKSIQSVPEMSVFQKAANSAYIEAAVK